MWIQTDFTLFSQRMSSVFIPAKNFIEYKFGELLQSLKISCCMKIHEIISMIWYQSILILSFAYDLFFFSDDVFWVKENYSIYVVLYVEFSVSVVYFSINIYFCANYFIVVFVLELQSILDDFSMVTWLWTLNVSVL